MALFKTKSPTERLMALLQQERAALLQGNLGDIEKLQRQKHQHLESFQQDQNLESLVALKHQVASNQRLLAAAAQGVRSATATLEKAKQGQNNLKTYQKDGQAQQHHTGAATVQKRA